MHSLAQYFEENTEIWYLTGLLHDIDLPQTINDLGQHGLLAGNLLKDLLPKNAIEAIKTHEHSTGLSPDSLLGNLLIFADMFEIMAGTVTIKRINDCINEGNWRKLREDYPNKNYHIDIIDKFFVTTQL